MRDLLLDDVVGGTARPDVEPGRGDQPARLDRIPTVRVQRDQLAVELVAPETRASRPSEPSPMSSSRVRFRISATGASSRGLRGAVEAADAQVDGVHGAPADHPQELVAGPLDPQAALDQLGVAVPGHLDRPGIAEEVGGVKEEHVQAVALQPLPAVDQPAKVGGSAPRPRSRGRPRSPRRRSAGRRSGRSRRSAR